jgi:hypothetical protein
MICYVSKYVTMLRPDMQLQSGLKRYSKFNRPTSSTTKELDAADIAALNPWSGPLAARQARASRIQEKTT